MLSVIDKTKEMYMEKMFKLYGEMAEQYIEKFTKYAEEGDFDKAEYWRLECLDLIIKRQKLLNGLLELKGYR